MLELFDTKTVEDSCKQLSKIEKKLIKKNILKCLDDKKQYTHTECIVFWLADLLSTTKLFSQSSIFILLEYFLPQLIIFGKSLSESILESKSKKLPVCRLAILDRKYVYLEGCAEFIDLNTGEKLTNITKSPLESLTYNLTTLFILNASKFKNNNS